MSRDEIAPPELSEQARRPGKQCQYSVVLSGTELNFLYIRHPSFLHVVHFKISISISILTFICKEP